MTKNEELLIAALKRAVASSDHLAGTLDAMDDKMPDQISEKMITEAGMAKYQAAQTIKYIEAREELKALQVLVD